MVANVVFLFDISFLIGKLQYCLIRGVAYKTVLTMFRGMKR